MSNLRVIVIGGGPTGLVAAHGLSKAGIDFIVLEAQSVLAKDVGASLVMTSYSVRVLAQLGLLDRMRDKGHELMHQTEFTNTNFYGQAWLGEDFNEE